MAQSSLLQRIVEAVSDGAPVDWERASDLASTPAERERLAQLRVLHDISRFNHSSAEDETTVQSAVQPPASRRTWVSLEVRALLGTGAFGSVYRAWDPKLQREVALKLVDTARFRGIDPGGYLREGRLLARVRHPNVAQVHGADVTDGFAGVWMELIPGRTLEAILSEQGPFGAEEAGRVGIEVCRGLAAVHAAGLVHRDVKASNVMRERGGRIVLMDLGAGFDIAAEASQAGDTTGTPLYMAPEVVRGSAASQRSDVYSLGVVLFRLVSFAYPIEASTLDELIQAHATGRRRSLRDLRPDLPPEFIRIVDKATVADSAQRYAGAGELQAALEAFVGAGPQTKTATRSRRPVGSLMLAGAAALLALAATLAVLVGRSSTESFKVEATLYRNADTGRVALRDGEEITTGDRLSMAFETSTRAHLYVLNQDDSGDIYLLFPVAGLKPGNPLAPGVSHRLPGSLDGRPQAWIVTSGGGNERFLLVASREPLAEFERDLATLPLPTTEAGLRYPRLSQASERRLRGVGGLGDDDTPGAAGGLFDRVEALDAGEEPASGIWIRRLQLHSR